MRTADHPAPPTPGSPANCAVMTGASALVALLQARGVTTAYAYPGTSELALCARLSTIPGLTLVNARGDKEAAFMAAGANLVRADCAVSLLHGARGLTNALGAIADARRSEIPGLHIVGMASRQSAAFLPPHAEPALIESAGAFARDAFDCSGLTGLDAEQYLAILCDAFQALDARPYGPVLLGIPQDVLEASFVPGALIADCRMRGQAPPAGDIARALRLISEARHPVVLVDDYFLRAGAEAETALGAFARLAGAPVLQVAYRRGPMLFQRIQSDRVPTFAGFYDPAHPRHRAVMESADLLVTVDDRNMYPRVVGSLPDCPKIAITGNLRATAKNGYLARGDVVVLGDASVTLGRLAAAVRADAAPSARRSAALPDDVRVESAAGCDSATALVNAIGTALARATRPTIIDDSQMFGGLIANNYDLVPPGVRVFGSHGGFVGGGLATAIGVALADPDGTVLCTVGDQGLTNGVQALAVAGERQVPLLVIVCNNGASVSLNKQARSGGLPFDSARSIIGNNDAMSYPTLAAGFGLSTSVVAWPDCRSGRPRLAEAADRLSTAVAAALERRRPHLLEVITPDDPDFWAGIWNVEGFESAP